MTVDGGSDGCCNACSGCDLMRTTGAAECSPAITGVRLFNANNVPVRWIGDGGVIDLCDFPGGFNVEARTAGTVASATFTLSENGGTPR